MASTRRPSFRPQSLRYAPSHPLQDTAYPSIRLVLTFKPSIFAHANAFFLRLEDLATFSLMVSCIFSQMRGTPMKKVGFTSCRVYTKVPCVGWSR